MSKYKTIDSTIESVLSDFNPKHRNILISRFGLEGKKKTLQAIGDELDITRERVRQIENQAVSKRSLDKLFEDDIQPYENVQGEILTKSGETKVILFNLSGHGHFDIASYDKYFQGELVAYEHPEAEIQRALGKM